MNVRILFATTMLAGGLATATMAQEATSIGEVVVTAQKRAENVQEVPISMEVVSAQTIEDFHSDTFRQLSVPNVNVGNIGGNDVIYIRGFGSPSQNYSFDQAVSLYVDGVYAGRSRQFMAPFFDLQRVEVLRGPQGALFGKNTAAGAISIISAMPTREFEGSVTGVYNFDEKGPGAWGYVSGPITDSLGIRLAAKLLDKDGYVENLGQNGRDEVTNKQALVRGILRYEPNDVFDYTGKVEYSQAIQLGNATVAGPVTGGQQPKLTRFTTDGPLGEAGFDTFSWNVAGTGNLQVGDLTLVSVSGFSWFKAKHVNDFDQTNPAGGVFPHTVSNNYPERFQQWSQEFRLQSPGGERLDWIVGAYYDNQQYMVDQYNHYGIAGLGQFTMYSHFKQQAESWSVFGQGTFNVSEELRLLGSLRYSHTSKRGDFTTKSLRGPFPFRPITSARDNISEGNVDPSITVQYDVAPRIMVYATYGQGSKSGGFVSNTYGTTNATFTFKPEKSENFEAGVKSTLADGRLVLNAAVYKTSFEDLQVSTYNSNVQSYIVGNAAEASSTGIEGSAVWNPIRNLTVTANGAYQDVKYDDYPGAQCLATQPISECNPTVPASVAANNLKGYPLPNISKWSGTLRVQYVAELPNGLNLTTMLAANGRSKHFNSDDQSIEYGLQEGYTKLDGRIELAPADGPWHVALVGTNLTDEITTSGSFRLPAPIAPVTRALYWVEPGRNVAIEAGVKF
ncbi:TonB-dependent receptor [Phenylobacterium sp. J367]|uniref:TonB-dependent receptor n=1 Tax=Phenylobacterium sp. J367 TaxID=2898435 RepID=UPI002150ABB8|nr:TonB-dependent receptor [Phenylobacterium sp. J367]MCR5881146.1 TonB-dependent receptor [Phenylobacterium sp. J367]